MKSKPQMGANFRLLVARVKEHEKKTDFVSSPHLLPGLLQQRRLSTREGKDGDLLKHGVPMVGIEAPREPDVRGVTQAPQSIDRPCPRWLQGIAQVKRLSSAVAQSREPAAVYDAMAQICAQNAAERLSAARLLSGIARHGDTEVLDVLLGNTISSAGFGEHAILLPESSSKTTAFAARLPVSC